MSRESRERTALAPAAFPLVLFLRSMQALAKILFLLALGLSLTRIISPPVALLSGIVLGLLFTNPYAQPSRTAARVLLQVSVVALGFGMNLHEVLKAGRSGFIYTALGITFAFLVGSALGKILQVQGNSSFLITTGTAICGGSAIAAIGPIVQANEEEMAVSLGTIFILNSVALARALWIVPLALVTAAVKHHGARIQFPWFILFFVFAALANTYLPAQHSATKTFFTLGRFGLTATLFLIGTGISRRTLKEVGWRPLLQGVLLWVAVGLTSLYFIRIGLIAF